MKSIAIFAVTAVALASGSCKGNADKAKAPLADPSPTSETAATGFADKTVARGAAAGAAPARDLVSLDEVDAPPAPEAEPAMKEEDGEQAQGGESGARARSWFPETFLFEPLVVTDASGSATVSAPIPDRLTQWRILALAHSRGGAQAGAVAELAGTLPVYVDPVVPERLRVGDQVRVPIQVVNTTAAPVTAALRVSATGGAVSGGSGSVSLGAGASAVRSATLRATAAGEMRLAASLDGADAVVKTIRVEPAGRPIRASATGTLAAPRAVELPSGAGRARVRLQVYPGALALVRAELASAPSRGGVAGDAFALRLAGEAPGILSELGAEIDRDALRTSTLLLTQRVVRHARVLSTDSATLLARAALAHGQSPILSNLGRRAVAHLESTQLPDGTCGGETDQPPKANHSRGPLVGETGWTLQRLLVATADCARAAASSRLVVVRAAGAAARHAERINDGYTAAAILAAEIPLGAEVIAALRETVRESIAPSSGGHRELTVAEGVVRADGLRPGAVEASALAVLALEGDPEAKDTIPELGATVLAGYSPDRGWGDGRANLVALEAVTRLFADPIPEGVSVTLRRRGQIVAEGTLDAAALRDVVTLAADDVEAGGDEPWEIRAEPAVPGLGFALTVTRFGPWPPAPVGRGLEIAAPAPARARVGAAVSWPIRVAAAAGEPLSIRLEPPAGVQIDREPLEGLVASGALLEYRLADGVLTMTARPLAPGASFAADLRAIPTLGGSLQSGPATVRAAGLEIHAPPSRWTVR